MRISRLTGPGRSAVVEVPDPEPGPGQALVRVRACGICVSELPAWRAGAFGPAPMGHEVAGEVAAVGPGVDRLRVGDRVTGLIYGGLAEYAVADAALLVPLPAAVPFPYGLGEPLGCVLHAVGRLPPPAGTRVAVLGLGFLGLTFAGVLAAAGASVLAVSSRRAARERAAALGATAADRVDPRDLVAEPDERRLADGYEVVVEASGRPDTLELAGKLVGVHGTLLVAGYHVDGPRTVDVGLWNWKAITVVNGHVRRPAEHAAAVGRGVELLRTGAFSLAPLVTRRLPLDQVDEAFRALTDRPPDAVKTVIEP